MHMASPLQFLMWKMHENGHYTALTGRESVQGIQNGAAIQGLLDADFREFHCVGLFKIPSNRNLFQFSTESEFTSTISNKKKQACQTNNTAYLNHQCLTM